jgi:hypothetical protein
VEGFNRVEKFAQEGVNQNTIIQRNEGERNHSNANAELPFLLIVDEI